MRFRVVVEQLLPRQPAGKKAARERAIWSHTFEFRWDPVEAVPIVVAEELVCQTPRASVRLVRRGERFESIELSDEKNKDLRDTLLRSVEFSSSDLDLSVFAPMLLSNIPEPRFAKLRVFQLNSVAARSTGSPIPDPTLERFGGNLPAVIFHLKKHHPAEYEQILASLRKVLPDLEGLDVTQTRALSLSLQQRGRVWPAEDLSDGTLQAISTLAAAFDPRISILVLEEPENNVHPWALRGFAEAFREAAKTKQIILTTHSPILLDQLKPEEIWIVQKPGPSTKIDPLLTLDPSLQEAWEGGHYTLSEYLDSGALPEAVPAAARKHPAARLTGA